MALTFYDPKTALHLAQRQEVLLSAEEVLQRLVKLKSIERKVAEGVAVSKKDREFLKKNWGPVWRVAFNVVKELDRTHPRKWNRGRV